MDTTASNSMETSTMVVTERDDELVTLSGTSWVTNPTTVIKTIAPVTTATITMATGQQKTITIIPKVIKTENTKPIRKK